MPSDDNQIFFTGDNGAECEDFIQQVYSRAWQEGHTRDNDWIADFVSMCFRGKALRWYLTLPLEARRDWELVQQGLLQRWPSEDNEAKPSLAAAAPPSNSPSFNYKIGRLKAKVNGKDEAWWISTKTGSNNSTWSGTTFLLTNSSDKALHAQIIPLPDQLWRLRMLNHSSGCNLVGVYVHESWETSYGILVGVDVPHGTSLREHRSTYSGEKNASEFKSDVWSFSTKDQELSIRLREANKPEKRIFMTKSTVNSVILDEDPASPQTNIELFFEQLF